MAALKCASRIIPGMQSLLTAASVRDLRSSFRLPEHCTSAEALALLPQVVTHAMQLAEKTGKDGSDKRQLVIDAVNAFYGHAPNAEGDDAALNPVLAIGSEVLTALIPVLIDQLIAVDKGQVVISPVGQGCFACCAAARIVARRV
jgi:hypothetical protein